MIRNNVPVQEVEETVYSTIDAGIKCITSCFVNCCASFFHTKPGPKLLASPDVTQKLKECLALMLSHDNDMRAIHNALKIARADVRASYKEATKLLTSSYPQYKTRQPIEFYEKSAEQRADMLDCLSELLDSYPKLEPEDETSLDRLNVFYSERDTHHQKVMTMVETYLPETYAALKEEQPVLVNKIASME